MKFLFSELRNHFLIPIYLTLAIGLVIIVTGCFKDDSFNEDSNFRLDFSADTIFFDTTFTTVGSATKLLKAYNHSSQPVLIDEIRIEGTSGIHFSFNVDGYPSSEARNIRIEANDSLYLFIKVKVDPDQSLSESPFVLIDKLQFHYNETIQSINLLAWGQNANYITNKNNIGKQAILTCNLQSITWDDPKPYIIYGQLVVDECTLNIPPGTRIYIHGGLVFPEDPNVAPYVDGRLIIFNKGKLNLQGTSTEPVTIQGDRLEKEFTDIPGQWGGLAFISNNNQQEIRHLHMKNSNFGILADSGSRVNLSYSIIENISGNCLIARHSNVRATNCLFANSASHNVVLTYGGQYTFEYCTANSESGQSFAVTMDNLACVEYDANGNCTKVATNRLNANFSNCILTGTENSEIIYTDFYELNDQSQFNFSFNNCLIKGDSLQNNTYFQGKTDQCVYSKVSDQIFKAKNEGNYTLDSLSIGRNIGRPIPGITDDLINQIRDNSTPDAGCYENNM